MKVRSVLFVVFLVFMIQTGQSQTDSVAVNFSLTEAKNYALENSPVLLNSARDIEIARKKIWESISTGLPQATLSSTYSYSPQLAGLTDLFTADTSGGGGFGFVMDPEDLKTSFSMNVQVSQLIFNGQYLVGLKASKVYANLSELANSKSRIGIIENITTTYFTALVAREAKTILDSTLSTVQKTLYESEQFYKNGFVESTDVDQLKILVSNIKSSLSVSERQINLMDRLLKFQMGIPIDQEINLTDRIDPLVEVLTIEAGLLDSFNIENNVDFQMLTTQEKLMKLDMQAQKAQFLPTLSGFYQRYEDYDDNFFNDQSPNTFGLSLSLPLWSSGQRLSQVAQKRIEYLKAKTNTQMASESLLIQYETAISDFLAARDIYAMQKENRNLSLKIYQRAIKKYHEGVGTSLDLNQTQTQYFDTQSSYFQALISFVTAKQKLESLLAGSNNQF